MAENDFRTPLPRNEKGQFLARNDQDKAIGVVLAEAEERRNQAAAKSGGDDKKEEEKKTTTPPKSTTVDGVAAEFWNEFFGEETPEGDKGGDKDADKTKVKEGDKSKEAEKNKEAEKGKEKPKDQKDQQQQQQKPPQRVAQRQPAPTGMTPEQIAQIAAETAARVAAPKKDEAKKDEASNLSPSEQRKFATLKHMEVMFPEKYKNAAQRFQTAQAKLKAYADQWEKDNPGKKFDENAEEHEEYFENNDLF